MDEVDVIPTIPMLGSERPREATIDQERKVVYRQLAVFLAESERYAFSRQEAAARLGVSVEFFEQHVAPEIRSIRRGRRLLVPATELVYWLWRAAA
jgi:hypothetical protein